MAISIATAESVYIALRKHLSPHQMTMLLNELQSIKGNASFRS